MRYIGSKNRLAKYITPILQKTIDENGITTYYEPFVGGANMIDKIRCEKRIGNDIHPELISMWQVLQQGWQPPNHISEEEYCKVRDNREAYPPHYVGYVGFNSTFGARYFGGYARGFKSDGVTPRDQSDESYRNIMRQLPNVQDVEFVYGDYRGQYSNIENAVIYCDPPYIKSKKYYNNAFDYDTFWNWCREKSRDNYVYISGYEAPEDFTCVWSKECLANFSSTRGDGKADKARIEKLFIYIKKENKSWI